MHKKVLESLGTRFTITVWDAVPEAAFEDVHATCFSVLDTFDRTYSRFKSDSLVSRLYHEKRTGVIEVPQDLTAMLRLYDALNRATRGKINPLIGPTIADIGYDERYSFEKKEVIRPVPDFRDTVRILDDTHIQIQTPVLFDLGALGKGYAVDLLYAVLEKQGFERFLIDGSGDIRYRARQGESIVCGLEHPLDASMVVGTLAITGGSLCASATNRRRWKDYNHYLDPDSLESPQDIIAVWVYAETAALADGLSSALFFTDPSALSAFPFESLMINKELRMKQSAGFAAELFV